MRLLTALVTTALLIFIVMLATRTWLKPQREPADAYVNWIPIQGIVRDTKYLVADGIMFSVVYDYQIDGMDYSANQEWYSEQTIPKRSYKSGDPVTVLYDPNNPKRAIVEPTKESPWSQLSRLCIPAFAIAIGSVVIWSWAAGQLLMWGIYLITMGIVVVCLYSLSIIWNVPFTIMLWVIPVGVTGVIKAKEIMRRV